MIIQNTRRSFLKTVGGLGFVLGTHPLWAFANSRSRLSPQEVKARIRGPILTLPTPFTADFKVDYAGVRNLVKLGLANGIGVYELTAGNSQYSVLSYDEVKKLTRVFIEAVGGRGIVIAATGPWWTGQAVDYARYAESVGADAVQVLLPPGGSDEGYVEHFRKIAAATKIAIVLQGDPKPALIERFVQIPSVVSMKEDGSEEYYVEIVKKFGQRLAIFCGGQKRRYLVGQPYGSPAYFSFFITFAPEIAVRFYQAIQKNDLETARAIVERYEKPVFDFCGAGPRGFHAYWHGLLEHFGVAKRYVRPPEDSCTDEDMQRVAALCERLGLKPVKR
ncbi:MAG: dihydrodipicolinate synthase family protein [Verrucomicrobia bacterium]|nr:dihydrodipicolinate synthase family protein [Verrucomicrobiota bacterium]